MASSEIEVVSSDSKTQKNPTEVPVVDVFSASAYGDFQKLRKFVEQDGASLSNPDVHGYYALHWAALNNFPDIAQYIIEHGGDVNATENIQQTALHWAAVQGAIAAADVLLQNGARVEAADVNGYRVDRHCVARHPRNVYLLDNVEKKKEVYVTDESGPNSQARTKMINGPDSQFGNNKHLMLPECLARHFQLYAYTDMHIHGYAVHVAAQYGQTSFLNHIVAKYHADFDAPDNEGRSPLHWAAYKGFADTVRLLLFRDASQGRQDKEGCTPLHWAALRGNVEACTVLVYAGTKQELTVKDNAGFTPVQIASDKGHQRVALFLANQQRAHSNRWRDKFCSGKMADIGFAPILLCTIIIQTILFMNSVLAAPNLTKVTAAVGLWGWAAISLAVGSLIMFYRCSSRDPGYIKRAGEFSSHTDTEDRLLNIDLNNNSVWMGNWSQLCPTCKIIRPVRSKHCPTCNRCVEQFDHHCPWISNCVGKRNKRDFFIFICMGTLTSIISAAVTVQRIWSSMPARRTEETWIHHVVVQHPSVVAFLFLDVIILVAATTLTVAQATQIARNITTNELANAIRYGYLRGPDGRFRNPYNHGCRKNCADFIIQGHTDDDEIAWPPLQQVTS